MHRRLEASEPSVSLGLIYMLKERHKMLPVAQKEGVQRLDQSKPFSRNDNNIISLLAGNLLKSSKYKDGCISFTIIVIHSIYRTKIRLYIVKVLYSYTMHVIYS